MARHIRFQLPDFPQHIIQRGHNRLPCFFAEEDYRFYLQSLQVAAEQAHCDVHAYVLMPNHVQILATPRHPDAVSRMMQSLGRRYVQFINHRYHRSGTLWEGRYRASLVDSRSYLLSCYRFIELTPVREGAVELPSDYAWSSYNAHVQTLEHNFLRDHEQYLQLGESEEDRQQAYLNLFQYPLEKPLLHLIEETVNIGMVLGGDQFKSQIDSQVDRPVSKRKRGRPPKKPQL